VSSPEFEKLIKKVAEFPPLVAYLEANFSRDPYLVSHLLAEADESPFSLQQWVEALYRFDEWLSTHGLSLPVENQIGYVGCSAEAGSAYATLTPLPLQVLEMLETYGCDQAVEK
jgi:hypothetical protein